MSFMVTYAPPGRPSFMPETRPEAEARYESIADDIVEVFKTEKSMFNGSDGKLKSMILVQSIMHFEAGFRKDIDLGKGPASRGDNGNSVCLMQLNIGGGRTSRWNTVLDRPAYDSDPKADVVDGWNAQEIYADRKKCIRAGVRLLRWSIATCSAKGLSQKDWLRVYTSGNCDGGGNASANRMNFAVKWYSNNKPTFDDTIYATLFPPTPVPVVVTAPQSPVLAVKK
jgi:hypothetical protein